MKKLVLLILILWVSNISYSQSKSIVAAWLWRDSKTSVSLFIRDDSTIEQHVGPVNEPISGKNLKRGTYKLKDNKTLVITWSDKSSEAVNFKLIDNWTIFLQLKDSTTNTVKSYTFKKIVDEEVIEN